MKKDIIEIFNLQGLWVDKFENKGDENALIHVRSPRKSAICPRCRNNSDKIHQYRSRKTRHGIFCDKKIILAIKYRRFMCKYCGKPFTEKLPGINNKSTSENFRKQNIKELSQMSINSCANKMGISVSTQTRYLRETMENHNIDWNEQGNKIILGIDEHSYAGRNLVITVTNISNKKLLTILKDDNQSSLKDFIKNMPNKAKNRVKESAIDMKVSYKNALLEELPNAKIVVDHFHVISAANRVIDEVRSVLFSGTGHHPKIKLALLMGRERLNEKSKEKLENIFEKYKAFPNLKVAYYAKEKLRDMYKSKSKEEARRKFKMIILYLGDTNSHYIQTWRKTLIYWQEYILNYFDNRTTNAFTEGCNTKIKMIKRMSFGFRNIDNYIAKVMLSFVPILWIIHHTI